MKIFAIARLSLRRMLRDRTAMFFVILLPFFIILIVGSATKQFATTQAPLGLVSGRGTYTSELVGTLERTRGLKVTRLDDAETLRKALRRGLYSGGVVIPDDYDARVRAGRPVNVVFMADAARPPMAVRAAVTSAVAKQGAILQAADFAASRTKQSFKGALSAAHAAARTVPAIGVRTETRGTRSKQYITTGFEYTAPSQLVLFVFITALAGSGILIANRQQGITRRMYGTPTTAGTIVVGETLARFAQAAFQALFIVVIGTLIFGVNFGNPIAASALITMFVLVATSFALLAGTVFRTQEQAGSVGPPVGIAIGMLAGCMWPRFLMPLPMQHLGQLFPQAWAMDAFVKLTSLGVGIRAILPELAILAGYVAVILPIATWRLRRSIVA